MRLSIDSGPSQDYLSPTIRPQEKILHVLPGLNHSIALLDYTFKSYH